MAPARPERRARPWGSGPAYPSSAASASTRSRRAGLSWSGRLNAFDAVVREMPSRSARVCNVTRSPTPARLLAAALLAYRGVREGGAGERAAASGVEGGESGGGDHGESL